MANFDAGDWLLCKVWFAETVAALNPEELERMILDAQNAAAERGNLTTCLSVVMHSVSSIPAQTAALQQPSLLTVCALCFNA